MRLELSPDDAEVIAQMMRDIDRWPAVVRSALIIGVANGAIVFDAAAILLYGPERRAKTRLGNKLKIGHPS